MNFFNKKLGFIPFVLLSAFQSNILQADNFEVPVESGRYRSAENINIFSSSYADGVRIPSMLKINNGDKLFFIEKRKNQIVTNDFKEQSIKMRRMKSNGILEDVVLVQSSDELPVIREFTHNFMNPTTAYDPDNNVIHLFYQDITTFRDGEEIGEITVRYVTSADSGVTWSSARDLTNLFNDVCEAVIVGPGSAIRIPDGPYEGRIIVPLHTRAYPTFDVQGECADKGNTIADGYFKVAYSDDNGSSWKTSARLSSGSNQAGFGEKSIIYLNEIVYMFSRLRGEYEYEGSGLAYSTDGGTTWIRGFNSEGPEDNGNISALTGRFVTPTQSSLATDGQKLYYTTSTYHSSDKSLANRKEAWIHQFSPSDMLTKEDSPINYVQPITKSGFSNVSTMYLGNNKIGIFWEEVKTWKPIRRIWGVFYTELDTRDFREITDPAWLDNKFEYHPTKNGSHHLLNSDI